MSEYFMLRIGIPNGILSSHQLRTIGGLTRKYARNLADITTRQNIQYNWPTLESVPDILALLATVEMHAIQTSGNCVRNITSDPLAGVAADEIVDRLQFARPQPRRRTNHGRCRPCGGRVDRQEAGTLAGRHEPG